LKFLLVGLGSVGRRHLRNLLTLGENDVLLYRTGKSTLPDEELEQFPACHSLDEALVHNPDAVIIANPTAFHLDVAIPFAEHGCHILIEKPVSHTMDRVEELEAVLEIGKGQVLVGYQFRFHPGLEEVRNWVLEERIGKVLYARAHWGEYLPGWHPWENFRESYAANKTLGGGVVLTLSHPIDYLQWILGKAVEYHGWVDQLSGWQLDVEDTAELFLKHSSGAQSTIHLNYIQRPPRHTLEIIGTKGTIRWDNADGSSQLMVGDERKNELYTLPKGFTRNDLFIREMEHFINVTKGVVEPICTLSDGIAALTLAIKILSS
jgi:predicted dehydrogenase